MYFAYAKLEHLNTTMHHSMVIPCTCLLFILGFYIVILYKYQGQQRGEIGKHHTSQLINLSYSQVHKYWDIDTMLRFLALYTTTMNKGGVFNCRLSAFI